MPDSNEWARRVTRLRQWQQAGERAPHKPLLLPYVIGRWQRTGSSAVAFVDAKSDLTRLLVEFGPPRTPKPSYPFHHLESDEGLGSPGSGIGQLVKSAAIGSLTPEFTEALSDPQTLGTVIRALLDANFPETIQQDILDAVGIDLDGAVLDSAGAAESKERRRDPVLRKEVLLAYEYRCAVCGYDGQLMRETVGIEAGHIRWWAAEGPDEVSNALALCSLHHKLLDRGVIGRLTTPSTSRSTSSVAAQLQTRLFSPMPASHWSYRSRVSHNLTRATSRGIRRRSSAHRSGRWLSAPE